jgi:cytochrome c biogenesis protein CcdA
LSGGLVNHRSGKTLGMFRVLGVVVTISLVDSLNPSTVMPAMYLASGERARFSLLEFTIAVFLTHLAGGVLIALVPGRLLLHLLPQISSQAQHIGELAFGIAMLTAAAMLWLGRERLARKHTPERNPQRKSSLVLGASIIAVELPTALPYFAAIAAVLGSGAAVGGQLGALAVYNVCFVLPLIGILATVLIARQASERILDRGRDILQRRWPVVLAVLLLVGGVAVTAVAAAGLA